MSGRLGLWRPAAPTRRDAIALTLLVLLALSLRVMVVRSTPAIDPAYHGVTAQLYVDVATAFLDGDGWVWNGAPATQHPPGYSAYLAAALSLSRDDGLTLARVGQAILDALTVVLVWAVARRAAPPWAAWFAAGAFAVSPEFVYSPAPILADGMVTAWLALMVYGACRWTETGRAPWAAVMALGAGLAMLWRSECLLFGPAVLVWGMLGPPTRNRAVAGLCTTLAVLAITYGPWVAWQNTTGRTDEPTRSGWANTILNGVGQRPNRFGILASDRYAGAIAYARGLEWHTPEANAHFRSMIRSVVTRDPAMVFQAVATREWRLLTDANVPWGPAHPGRLLSRVLLCGATALSLYGLAAGRIRLPAAAVLGAPVLLYIGTLGLIWYEPRYVVPGHLSLLWLAGAACGPALGRRRRWVVVSLLAVLGSTGGMTLWRWQADQRVITRLEAGLASAPWHVVTPQSAAGATVRLVDNSVEFSGPRGTPSAPGFVVLYPEIPTAAGNITTAMVDIAVEHGAIRVGLVQTVQFPAQPPEHLWIAEARVASPGRYTVVLPAENFIGAPIRLAIVPIAGGVGVEPGESAVRCRLWKVSAWPTEPSPSRPRIRRRPPNPA